MLTDCGVAVPVRHAVRNIADGRATEAQRLGIPALVTHDHLALVAPTGSGKTLVAAVAACIELATGASAPRRPRVLVLCPTRELTDQVSGVLSDVLEGVGARTVFLSGSPAARKDTYVLARPVDCLVATPGRMLDLIRRGTISLDDVGQLILDEADMLLGPSFHTQTASILDSVTRTRTRYPKILAMTATASAEYSEKLGAEFGASFHDIRIFADSSPATTPHAPAAAGPPASIELLLAQSEQAVRSALIELCESARSAMVFVPRRADVADLVAALEDHGVSVGGFTGRSAISVRTAAMDSLRSGEVSVLVSTDVTARGIDVADLAMVVHVGLPHSAEDLTHRSGRTGRGHRPPGLVVAVIAPEEDARLQEFADTAGLQVHRSGSARAVAGKLRPSDVIRRPPTPKSKASTRDAESRDAGAGHPTRKRTGAKGANGGRTRGQPRAVGRGRQRGGHPRRGR
ncbi:MAG TPA: DEAD/DEAH box helicase [Dietzia timorensis]|uniref:DEAD/DEAH box helicase n=1 Tax=Dietzia timorensis TaxID=499555 RepID=A0A921JY85_9ACTN|nr:DEAD/DEAH box helicase [Dietzia timorensis]HJE90934.1 DEAD/DEAH box helicase [Dietzia timorensis]